MVTLTNKEYQALMAQRKIAGVVVSPTVCDDVLKIISKPVSDVVTSLVISGSDEETVHAAAKLTAIAITRAVTDQVVISDQTAHCGDELKYFGTSSIPKHILTTDKYPESWVINIGKEDVVFWRVVNGAACESYAPVSYGNATVYASAILNGLQPPKCLCRSDKQTD